MIKSGRLVLLSAIAVVLSATCRSLASDSDELLKLVPSDVGACLIVDDFASHFQQLSESEIWKRVQATPLYSGWYESPQRRRMAQIWAIAPFYFGLSGKQLRDDIFGQSTVLAFRPGDSQGTKEVGILFCKATDEELLTTLVSTLTSERPGRETQKRSHRDHTYFLRREGNERTDFLLQIGSVGVLTDSEPAIQRVIDTFLDGGSFGDLDAVRAAKGAIPDDCVASLLIHPRAFDRALFDKVQTAKERDRLIAEQIKASWTSLQWMAWTIRLDQALELMLLWRGDAKDSDESTAPDARQAMAEFWRHLPPDTFAAAVTEVDLTAFFRFLSRLADQKAKRDVGLMSTILQQLLAGYDLMDDVLPKLGPMIGIALVPGDHAVPTLLGVLQIRDTQVTRDDLPLSVAIEFALRPLLVFVGMEHNRERSDQYRTSLRSDNGARIHFLHGSHVAPTWLQPAFAVHAGYFLAATNPQGIANWYSSEPKHHGLDTVLAAASDSDAPVQLAFVNLKRMTEHLRLHQSKIVSMLARSPEQESQIREKLGHLLSLGGLFDRILVSALETKQANQLRIALGWE